MTRIDFYGLPEVRPEACERFAARLAARAFRDGHRALLLAADENAAGRIEANIWDDGGAFLPVVRRGATDARRAPLLLALAGAGDPLAAIADDAEPVDLLVNLTHAVPPDFARFERVAEIVCGDEAIRDAGRARYRYYRERGYPLHYHDLARERSR